MVRTVVREHHWPPHKIGGFFLDAIDYNGLEYWFNDVNNYYDEIKKARKKGKDKSD
jgi:hypothetical protein